jgi:hypothetical protein
MTEPIMDEYLKFNPNPSEWYNYCCRSCDHRDWVEDIVVDAFPPVEPEGVPALMCPECEGDFRYDTSVEIKRSRQHPDHIS